MTVSAALPAKPVPVSDVAVVPYDIDGLAQFNYCSCWCCGVVMHQRDVCPVCGCPTGIRENDGAAEWLVSHHGEVKSRGVLDWVRSIVLAEARRIYRRQTDRQTGAKDA